MVNNKVLILIAVAFLVVLLYSCNFNATNYNEESQKEKAEVVTQYFYDKISKKSYNELEKVFSNDFYKATSKEQLLNFLKHINLSLGDFESKVLIDWKTTNTVGSNPIVTFVLVYEVTYEKFKSKETLTLIEEEDGIKILGYNVISNGLF